MSQSDSNESEGLSKELHSNNPAPKLANGKLEFDSSFSWVEHDQIGIRLKKASSNMSDRKLSQLVAGLEKDGYCITTIHGENLSVGQCCEIIIRQHLVAGLIVGLQLDAEFIKTVGPYANSKEFRAKLYEAPKVSSRRDFHSWFLARKDLTLRDLQMEVCKITQDAFVDQAQATERPLKGAIGESRTTLSVDANIAIRKKIEEQFEKLKKGEGFVQPKWRFEDSFELMTGR